MPLPSHLRYDPFSSRWYKTTSTGIKIHLSTMIDFEHQSLFVPSSFKPLLGKSLFSCQGVSKYSCLIGNIGHKVSNVIELKNFSMCIYSPSYSSSLNVEEVPTSFVQTILAIVLRKSSSSSLSIVSLHSPLYLALENLST